MEYRKAAGVVALMTGLGTAGTALFNSTPAFAVPSGAPPAVTETFASSLLPCDPNTTVGMEGCGEHKVLAADKQLDADIDVIWARLDAAGRRDFAKAQITWLSYRRADCSSQSDVYAGGSEQAVVYVDCLAGDDRDRRQDLAGFFADLTQDQSPKPRFP